MNRCGLSLIETVVSVVVVSLLFAAALNATGASAATRALVNDHSRGAELCQALMAEITTQSYSDPDTALDGLGPDLGESNGLDRTGFDDVDDFNGWSSSPPEERDGTAIPNTTGLSRSVIVSKYSDALNGDLFADAGEVKLVTVKVKRGDRLVYQLTTVRAPDWDTRGFER